jgi:hypothetical protein
MRFMDDEGRVWSVRDVALLPERTMVEPGRPEAIERYFVDMNGEKRLYRFSDGEPRTPGHEQLERQVRAAHVFQPARKSDPNLDRV